MCIHIGRRPTTEEIDDETLGQESSSFDSFGIGPLIGVSVAIGLVVAVIISIFIIFIKRKVCEHHAKQPTVAPCPQLTMVTNMQNTCSQNVGDGRPR